MFTQCPYCETVYPLPPKLLAEGRGRILCGRCERPFDALERLREIDDYAEKLAQRAGAVPRLDIEPPPEQGDLFAPAAPAGSHAPTFAGGGRASRPGHGLAWSVSALALTLLLGLQLVLAQSAELAADARWRPLLEAGCRWVACTLPPAREPQRLQLLAREIGPHPSMPDALLVTATVRNPGPWRQAWPQLELALSDLDGRPLALRRFNAAEYLGGSPDVDALAAGESVIARLELQDPGKTAVAFAFEFR